MARRKKALKKLRRAERELRYLLEDFKTLFRVLDTYARLTLGEYADTPMDQWVIPPMSDREKKKAMRKKRGGRYFETLEER